MSEASQDPQARTPAVQPGGEGQLPDESLEAVVGGVLLPDGPRPGGPASDPPLFVD